MVASAVTQRRAEPYVEDPKSGRSVAWILSVAIAAGVVALLGGRYLYRGEHDTKDGLELKMPPDAEAPVAATTTEPPPPAPEPAPGPSPVAVPDAAASVAVTSAVAPVRDAAVRPSAVAVAPVASAPVVTAPPVHASATPAAAPPPADSGNTGTTSKEITEQAQKALGDEKAAARAVQLAFLATQADPTNADAWLTLGSAYTAAGNAPQAMRAYRSCVQKAPNHQHVGECKAKAGITE